MTKTLQLAKPYTPSKLSERVYVSEKLDGVPVRFDVTIRNNTAHVKQGRTRQDEFAVSCGFIAQSLSTVLQSAIDNAPQSDRDWVIIGEVMHETYTGFKDISGVVRRQTPQTGLYLNIFDFWDSARPDDTFASRNFALNCLIGARQIHEVRVVKQIATYKSGMLQQTIDEMMPKVGEGLIVRDAIELFQPGKRTWGYQKVVREPTIDLRIIGIVDGVGKNAGAVGTLVAEYKDDIIGISVGKTDYEQRRKLWASYTTCMVPANKNKLFKGHWYRLAEPRMACIKYKPDEGYKALRQPTFQHWRLDKDVPDA